jgi:hypothetical protein
VAINRPQQRQIHTSRTGIAYIYCQYQQRGSQTAETLVGLFVRQLAAQNPASKSAVTSFYWSKRKRLFRVQELIDLAKQVAEGLHPLYIVADGLDKLSSDAAAGVKSLIKTFHAELLKKHNFHVIVSGRPYVLRNEYQSWPHIEVVPNEEDVRAMVRARIKENGDLTRQGRIAAGVVNRAVGLYVGQTSSCSGLPYTWIYILDVDLHYIINFFLDFKIQPRQIFSAR